MSSFLATKWADMSAKIAGKVGQFKNETFKCAVLAACALIAAADGVIEPEEKSKVAKLIGSNEHLKDFEATDLRDTFLGYCDKALDEFAKMDLMTLVKKLKPHRDQAETIMAISVIIANADGEFEDSEKKVVLELCKALGIPSEDYVPA